MQAIFAYHTAREAEFNICKQSAQNQFLPDLNSMEVQDKEGLAQDREQAAKGFHALIHQGADALPEDIKPEIVKVIKAERQSYLNQVTANKVHFKKRMLEGITSIFDDYIKFLFLIVEIQELIGHEKRKKNNSHDNFAKNIVINGIKNDEALEDERIRKNVAWDTDLVRAWYREYIKPQEFFIEYDNLAKATIEDDQELVQTIYKTIIFKNENINDYFEALDLGWSENKPILKSMVLKTIKSIENEESEPLMMELSKNWDEDLLFLKELYDLAIDKEEEYENLIENKSKNWEIDRVALTDRIILEMAIAEMIHFTSIPVKVTINEYIELSKLYSTPKSKQFVNGLLDVLSVELQKDGQIKKSGRGLLDNK
ncbi:transcription antitermination factor NusB [Reichenbachiella carrageenanivorans]|uniref:Transcription antitermination factor NusB n=1 Tax=Reichenbachiella carrageenanivorans TaxID=2979869 RepID=A0ABY6D1N8_9BACT|nr:transcription antitermination factor NusB [Reichenbachiella carrageenanivorans]UXX80077.1 transcription antitermination factor NusB [Reichenbachiella carrageenanivorans]